MKILAIYGASGCGRGVLPIVRDSINPAETSLVFVDDDSQVQGALVNGARCMSFEELCEGDVSRTRIAIPIAAPTIRKTLVHRCEKAGFGFHDVVARSHTRLDDVEVGSGAILCDYTMITSNVRIGRHFHGNIYSYVEHDCVIGDFVTFAPRVCCNGNVVIEDGAYIGTGAMLRQGTPEKPLRIGAGATVGMGAVVTKDVAAGVTVVGNPARALPPDATTKP